MMTQSRAESTRDTYNYGQYLNQFPPNTIKVIREFERIQKKICRHKMSIMFNEIRINEEMLPKYIYIYIYIYIYMLLTNNNQLETDNIQNEGHSPVFEYSWAHADFFLWSNNKFLIFFLFQNIFSFFKLLSFYWKTYYTWNKTIKLHEN